VAVFASAFDFTLFFLCALAGKILRALCASVFKASDFASAFDFTQLFSLRVCGRKIQELAISKFEY
jgi:hypothetical protein